MQKLDSKSLMNIIEYEKVRNDYRDKIILYKRDRRVSLGPNVTITFENKKTLSFQIQEIMRAERLVHDHQIEEEIEVYNSLMPPEKGLSATLFIEVTEESKIKTVLNKFIGLTKGNTLYIDIDGQKINAVFETGREAEEQISSVHYIQFFFTPEQKEKLINLKTDIKISINYNGYEYSEKLSDKFRESISKDFE